MVPKKISHTTLAHIYNQRDEEEDATVYTFVTRGTQNSSGIGGGKRLKC